MKVRLAILTIIISFVIIGTAQARSNNYPNKVPNSWHAPKWWLPQALCIHAHEGAFNDATGNGYEGGFQFLLSTWLSVNGPVLRDSRGNILHWASVASIREQLYRTWLVYNRDGHSWREWGTAGVCGLL